MRRVVVPVEMSRRDKPSEGFAMVADLKIPSWQSGCQAITAWRWSRFVFAAILLASALLKWQSFGARPASSMFSVIPQLAWAMIQIEFVMAVWLAVGWLPSAARVATLGLFSGFAGGSLSLLVLGRSNCGCWGGVELHPAWSLLGNVVAVGLLLSSVCLQGGTSHAPDSRRSTRIDRITSWRPVLFAGSIFLAGCIVVTQSEDLASRLGVLSPAQHLRTEPVVIDAGTGHVGELRQLKFRVHNQSTEPAVLLGTLEGCRCLVTTDLPLTILPDGKQEVVVNVRLGQAAGRQHGSFSLITSNRNQSTLICRWRADVILSSEQRQVSTNGESSENEPD